MLEAALELDATKPTDDPDEIGIDIDIGISIDIEAPTEELWPASGNVVPVATTAGNPLKSEPVDVVAEATTAGNTCKLEVVPEATTAGTTFPPAMPLAELLATKVIVVPVAARIEVLWLVTVFVASPGPKIRLDNIDCKKLAVAFGAPGFELVVSGASEVDVLGA